MLTGYLWSVIPTALVLTGAVAATFWFLRKPSSELFLLLGFSGVLVLAMIFMTLKIPSYAQAKAFYALSALTSFCFFGALGWETLTQRRTTLQIILGMFVLVWALNSFATYWIVPSVTQHLYAAKALGTEGKMDLAAAEAQRAIEADPSNATARGFRALSLLETGQEQESIKEAEHAVELDPSGSGPHLDLAICVNRSDQNRAIMEARRAIDLGPENSSAYQFLMSCLLESQHFTEAAELGREWLAVSPCDVAGHSALGSALAAKGDLVPAVQQLGYIMMLRPDLEQAHAQLRQILLSLAKEPDSLQRLQEIAANAPDSPRMLDELAWLFATYPESKSRDGTEAVRLAEHASELTERKVPALLDTLAAAYAEAGDFSRAISVGEEALKKAGSAGDNDAVKLSENILESLRKNLPYRQEPK
jgi:tetratricopeptide (TPR) repeat protein